MHNAVVAIKCHVVEKSQATLGLQRCIHSKVNVLNSWHLSKRMNWHSQLGLCISKMQTAHILHSPPNMRAVTLLNMINPLTHLQHTPTAGLVHHGMHYGT